MTGESRWVWSAGAGLSGNRWAGGGAVVLTGRADGQQQSNAGGGKTVAPPFWVQKLDAEEGREANRRIINHLMISTNQRWSKLIKSGKIRLAESLHSLYFCPFVVKYLIIMRFKLTNNSSPELKPFLVIVFTCFSLIDVREKKDI